MCDKLTGLRESLARFAAELHGPDLTVAQAQSLLADVVRIERIAAAMSVTLSARVADAGGWRAAGQRSPSHQLAATTGLSVSEAADRLAAGRRLAEQPELAAAGAAGRLSAPALLEISAATAADPAAAARLVELAGQASLAEVRDECRRTRAAAARDDGAAARQRIYQSRSLRTYTDREGVGHLHLAHLPEVIAQLMGAVTPIREQLFQQARKAGRRDRPEALDADALVAAVSGPAQDKPAAAGAKVIVRVDFDTLLRGYPLAGEVCEIPGYGPIPAAAVSDMLGTGNAILAAVVTKGQDVATVAHLRRTPTGYQHTALQWAQPECVVLGCHQLTRLERDHGTPWADCKVTLLADLNRLCQHHHDLKTHQGWDLIAGTGKRPMVAPTDARHPKYARTRSRPPPDRRSA